MAGPSVRRKVTIAARGSRPIRQAAVPRRSYFSTDINSSVATVACSTMAATSRTRQRQGLATSEMGAMSGDAARWTAVSEDLLSRSVAQAILAAIHFWVRWDG
jgi:hypothetical protein